MADVFLSYKSEDRQLANHVRSTLLSWGYTVWWDQDLRAGEQYLLSIKKELESARAIVVLLTTRAIAPPNPDKPDSFVIAEASWGQHKKPLIPIIVPPVEAEQLPPPFNSLVTLDWADHPRLNTELRRHEVLPSAPSAPQNHGSEQVYLHDVFTTGAPTVTEVERSGTVRFQELQAAMRMKGRIIRLFGPTQTGKTILARQALNPFLPLELDGGTISSRQAFYDQIAINYAPELPADARDLRVQRFLRDSKRPVIIEDFHRVPKDAQIAIINDAKGLIESGVNLVLISIPDCAKDLLEHRPEFKNRSIALEAPRWTNPQLKEIPRRGFAALNISIPDLALYEIVLQAYGNPLLVQEYCYRLCEKYRIFSAEQTPTEIPVTPRDLIDIFRAVGRDRSYSAEQLLRADESCIYGQRVRLLAGRRKGPGVRSVNLLGLFLVVLDAKGGLQVLKPLTIVRRARELVHYPFRHYITEESIVAAGVELVERFRSAGSGDTAVGHDEDKFYIMHPDFKVYLHWRFNPSVTGEQPSLERFGCEEGFFEDESE